MRITASIQETRTSVRAAKQQGKTVGFVPTMGALHEGHLSLVRAAKRQCDFVAASVFVNPTQFGPNEDLAKYPRTFESDRQKLEAEGVDLLFAPSVEEMYPHGAVTFVTVEGISDRLDGQSRPGHFRGVATVVAKLFHVVEPDFAFFGQKDAAQVAIIRRMVRDLALAVEIVVCPIVRDPDGLALSSRNVYLSPDERKSALALSRTVRRVEALWRAGERDARRLIESAKTVIGQESSVRLDYVEVIDPDTLMPISDVKERVLFAMAAYVGTTRLIDNLLLESS
jgi:pantoate--beta-alanine ligase